MKEIRLKERLDRVWNAFFASYGRLLPVQEKAIPIVLDGKDLILLAPAATGKTEAVCAPLLQRMLEEGWKPPSILYVCPTRALVNDIHRRLSPILSCLGARVGRKTAEHALKDAPHLLLTTPEGFDSLLCRNPAWMKNVEAVCLDEVHLYEGSARSDALSFALHRLRLIKGSFPSLYAMTATFSDPFWIAKKYFFKEFEAVIVKKKTIIDYKLLDFSEKELQGLIWELEGIEAKKVLFFCNTRAEAEWMALSLKKHLHYADKVFVHHASISKRERELIEEFMHRESVTMIVSTLTLEMGIDVWDVDAIVFLSPPSSCASLLQRLGRGARGKGIIKAFALYADEFEKKVFECMFHLAQRGWVEEAAGGKRFSVAVQQALSYILQRRRVGTSLQNLKKLLSPFGFDTFFVHTLILHLLEKRYLREERKGIFFPSSSLQGLFKLGRVHSNIERAREEYEVVDLPSGRVLGTIQSPKPTFTLQGKVRKVVKVEGKRVFVRDGGLLITAEKSVKKVFGGKGRALWDRRLGKMLRCAFFGERARDAIPYLEEGGQLYIFHFLGLVWGYLWAESVAVEGGSAVDVDGVYLQCKDLKIKDVVNISECRIQEVMKNSYKVLAKFLNLGSWFWSLPPSFQLAAAEEAAEVEKLCEHLKSATFYALTHPLL